MLCLTYATDFQFDSICYRSYSFESTVKSVFVLKPSEDEIQ